MEKTDISWLKESGKKPKPKVVDYSRHRTTKQPAPANTNYQSALPPPSSKPLGRQAKQKKRKNTEKKERKQFARVCKLSRRPQRTTAMSRNYREVSESGSSSQSECEELTLRKPKLNQTNGNTTWSVKNQQLELKRKKPVPAEEEEKFVTVKKPVIVEEKAGWQKASWAARLTEFPPSPPPIERMRLAAGESGALSGSLISPLQSPDAPPLLVEVVPLFRGIQASSFYRSERGSSKGKTPSTASLTHLGQAVPTETSLKSRLVQAKLNSFSPFRQKLLLKGLIQMETMASEGIHYLDLSFIRLRVEMVQDDVLNMNSSPLGDSNEDSLVGEFHPGGCIMAVV
ncbi:hypothetical protein SKAU_G00095550 [Synaphobranchus kaupii]|uniref:Uncharacterized protein n=1 Tax=Synaphobranchus kaupii TaxID=118154 RepID=A0A9Q1J5V2_SYNKA|nr:hypothetical protein SKAU_G00095550 [Synaphobranchus kaupii]